MAVMTSKPTGDHWSKRWEFVWRAGCRIISNDANLPHVVSCHGDGPAKIVAVIYAYEDPMIF
jgi:hypothetical protein